MKNACFISYSHSTNPHYASVITTFAEQLDNQLALLMPKREIFRDNDRLKRLATSMRRTPSAHSSTWPCRSSNSNEQRTSTYVATADTDGRGRWLMRRAVYVVGDRGGLGGRTSGRIQNPGN